MENEVAKRIKCLREHYQLSQDALAEIAGVTKAAVSRWEQGENANLKSNTIKKICAHYPEINPAWLLGGDVPMLKPSEKAQDLASKLSDRLGWLNEEQLMKLERFMDEWLS